jgi:hypothetical protein
MNDTYEKRLREVLASAGVEGADWWVSQINAYNEPQPLLEMAVFLREAWAPILRENDTDWIENSIAELEERVGREDLYALRFLPELPEFRESLKRVKASGIDLRDLTNVIRQFQIDTLANVVNILDGGCCFEDGEESNWHLYATDEDLEPNNGFSDMKDLMWEFDPDRKDE